ncbi:hypothetical protein [Enterococcus sp. DIV0170]|uniref:hypothetical protein n=1 Tax=Enterococcus sp. DIV0170 TaxID=2774642 RepID=UPI003F1EB876
MTGFRSLLGDLSQQLFYSTVIAFVVIGVPLIILAYIFLKKVIPVLILVWARYMIIQTRRGKVF